MNRVIKDKNCSKTVKIKKIYLGIIIVYLMCCYLFNFIYIGNILLLFYFKIIVCNFLYSYEI